MILVGNRQKEVLQRAENRTVTAIVNMAAPGIDPNTKPEAQFGLIMEGNQPLFNLKANDPMTLGSHFWKQDDTCVPLAAKDPTTLFRVLEKIGRRTTGVNSERYARMHFDDQKAFFDSEDLITEAVGIPNKLMVTFTDSSEVLAKDIEAVPFPKLRSFLAHLKVKLENIGGALQSATIVHGSARSAFEYYAQDFPRHGIGQSFTYGDVMLARGHNLLVDMGTPLVKAPKPTRH